MKLLKKLFCRHRNNSVVCWHWTHGPNANEIRYLEIQLKCNDCGSKIKGNGRIDIYLKDYNTCMKFGVQDLEGYVLTPDMIK